jgi:hypothetical protein
MKDLRLPGFLVILLLQLAACNSEKTDTSDASTSDNVSLKTDLPIPASDKLIIAEKIPEAKEDVIIKHENDGMMEVELGTVAQALHPKLNEVSKSIWLPPKHYILLMENFIIENGELRECLSIKN